ncbi:MAG: hypothetical protein H7A19_07790 [Rhodanobacteraceae bacterium]|nr:hypothetical protein [Rhodanobacteraceae bacterium]
MKELSTILALEPQEPKLLARLKKKVSENFSCDKKNSLRDLCLICIYYDIIGHHRTDACLRVLTGCMFSGNHDRWAFVEAGLALSARRARIGNNASARQECLQRISQVGFVKERLKGVLLRSIEQNIKNARDGRSRSSERSIIRACRISEQGWRESLHMELVFIIEHVIDSQDVSLLEKELDENRFGLRGLLEE